jgi:hypothetical protein
MKINFADKRFQFAIAVAFLVVMVALPYFTESSMPDSQRDEIKDQVSKMSDEATVSSIFGNNAYIAMFTLVPIFGIPWIGMVMYNTGEVFVAYQASPLLLALNVIVWIEFSAYALMLMGSVKLTKLLYERKIGEGFRMVRDRVFVVVVLLFFGAVLEKLMIG